jgi:hypothetical protein
MDRSGGLPGKVPQSFNGQGAMMRLGRLESEPYADLPVNGQRHVEGMAGGRGGDWG